MEEKKDNGFMKGVAAGVFFSLVFGLSFFAGSRMSQEPKSDAVVNDPLTVDKLTYLEKLIDEEFLYEKDSSRLAEGLYAGLLYGLGDPYAAYYTAEEYAEETKYNDGSFMGVGITITQDAKNSSIVVAEVFEDSPAEEAGVLADDVIREVNGQDAKEMTTSDVVLAIRGSDGEAVLKVYRPSEDEELTLNIPLRQVEIKSVEYQMLEDGVGYLKIREFSTSTPGQYEKAMEALRGGGMTKLVVDLRNNPGGMLNSVCDIMRDILPKGLILYTEDKWGKQVTYECDGEHQLDIPLAVLINGDSASASEIFAGAVKDHGVGTLVGETTFGKGIVQSLTQLPDGSAVKMTTEQYFTPGGNAIQGVGVSPDIEVGPGEDDDPEAFPEKDAQLQAAIEVLSRGKHRQRGEKKAA